MATRRLRRSWPAGRAPCRGLAQQIDLSISARCPWSIGSLHRDRRHLARSRRSGRAPGRLGEDARRLSAHRGGQRLHRRDRLRRSATRRRRGARAAQRGFGAACYAGLVAATAGVVCFMDADGSLDPADLPLVADPVLRGDRSRARRPPAAAAARGRCTHGWPTAASPSSAPSYRTCAQRSRADAGRSPPPLLDLGIEDRRSGWPLEMVFGPRPRSWRIVETRATYAPRVGRSKVTGTIRGTIEAVHDMRPGPAGMNESPALDPNVPRSSCWRRRQCRSTKTRCSLPAPSSRPLAWPRLPWPTPSRPCRPPPLRRVLRARRLGGPVVASRLRGDRPARRRTGSSALASRSTHVGGPALLVGMDTPQVTSPPLAAATATLAGEADAVLGLADDGGYWAIGLRQAAAAPFVGVPMSTDRTGRDQSRASARGLRVELLPRIADVDTFDAGGWRWRPGPPTPDRIGGASSSLACCGVTLTVAGRQRR